MEGLTPPPSGRLVPKIWTQWPLSPRLFKTFGPQERHSDRIDSVAGDKITEPAPPAAEPEDGESKGNRCSCSPCRFLHTYFGYRT
jgi:hypothetical protein